MISYTAPFRLLMVWLTLSALSAHAFDEDGFRTGMTVTEVKETLPKDRVLDRLGDEFEWYFVLHRDKKLRTTNDFMNATNFAFCKGLLMSYTKPLNPDTEFLPKMKVLLDRFGQPSSIRAYDSAFDKPTTPTMGIMWWAEPDRVYLSFSQATPAKKNEKATPARTSVTFSTPNPECGEFDVPARRPWQLPPPFGTVG